MRKKIGIIAAVLAVIDLIVWVMLLVSGNALGFGGFTKEAGIVFVLWFVLIAIAIPCLLGELIKFIGKSFSAGYNSQNQTPNRPTVYCTKCGQPIDASVAFCPYCGNKRR